ncbi:MAG TPA: FlgD immunoglobulin-like domain containing protein [Candidatus Saccharimonadales bacterium]|nr:FlgD immunoglobulin-like domain containing protein [Candidatus Saccharimonadales bacterium]
MLLAATLVLVLGFVLPPHSARADCSAAGGLHINQVRYFDRARPDDGYVNAMVELFNKGPSPAPVGGYVLTTAGGAVKATLPAWTVPAGGFLDVFFAFGGGDSSFAGGVGTYFTDGDTANIFNHDVDGVALFAPAGGPLVDFMCWSSTGMPPSGAAYDSAVTDGLWPAGEYVPVDPSESLSSLRLSPDGYDRDDPRDWQHQPWSASNYAADDPGPNALQVSPGNQTALPAGVIHLAWSPVAAAASYRVRVATDSAFTSVVADTTVSAAASSADLYLPGPGYFWTVQLIDSCGPVAQTAEWSFFDASLLPAAPSMPGGFKPTRTLTLGVLGVRQQFQHKDTRLLCLSDNHLDATGAPTFSRPGCGEGVSLPGVAAPWDGPHPDGHASVIFHIPAIFRIPARDIELNCAHCQQYCARASVSMINQYFGGTLSQDRVSFQYMQAVPGVHPEGDLGHDRPVPRATTNGILTWALLNSAVTPHLEAYVPAPGGGWRMVPNAPTMADIKRQVDAGFPLMCGQPGHVFVIDGYCQRGTFFANVPPVDLVHKLDPWPTAALQGWVAYNRVPLNAWWEIARAGAAAVAGRAQEATVTTDTDGDGVMDFDEGAQDHPADRPRLLQSDPKLVDTDGDEVPDKAEIRAYTFHLKDHPTHPGGAAAINQPNFPVAPDGLRAEASCDADGDGQFDGAEDINGNGINPEPGETCMFDPASKNISFRTDHAIYDVGQHVILNGGVYHANSTYTWYLFQQPVANCAFSISPNQPYMGAFQTGNVTTDAAGNIPATDLGGFPPGCYYLFLDVGKDGKFGTIVRRPPDVSEICDRSDGFSVREATAVEVSGPFAQPQDGRVLLTWWLSPAVGAQREVVQRAAAESGPWADVGVLDGAGLAGAQQYDDRTLQQAGKYYYRVVVTAGGSNSTFGPVLADVPLPPFRVQPVPNPSRGSLRVSCSVPRAGTARLEVFDVAGRRVRMLLDGLAPMGHSDFLWDGRTQAGARAPAGSYYLRLSTGAGARVARVTLLQ